MKLLGMGRTQDLRSCLETEFNLARYCGQGKADFFEGVRAMLIDKDKKPQWKHKTVWEVSDAVFYAHKHAKRDFERTIFKSDPYSLSVLFLYDGQLVCLHIVTLSKPGVFYHFI